MFRFNSAILHFSSQFSSVVGVGVRSRDHIKSFTQRVRLFHFKIAFIFYLMHEYFIFIIYRINIESAIACRLQQAALHWHGYRARFSAQSRWALKQIIKFMVEQK